MKMKGNIHIKGRKVMKWNIKNRKTLFINNFIHLVEKNTEHPKMGVHNYYTIDFPAWVNVVAITKDDELILVKQYRHGLEDYTLETPGGVVDPHEDPKETATRELLEETGYQGKVIPLGKVAANPAIQNNYCYIFLISDCEKVADQNLDGTEEIELELFPFTEVKKLIDTEKIVHSLSVVSLLKAKLHLNR